MYCERTGQDFWGEPLNAVSNGAFLIIAVIFAIHACRRGDKTAFALALLVGVVGIGSFLFHTLANRWSYFGDVVPIGIFILSYLALALRRFFGLGTTPIALCLIVFATATAGLMRAFAVSFLNGSMPYASAWGSLLVVGLALRRFGNAAASGVLAAFASFSIGVTCRSIGQK